MPNSLDDRVAILEATVQELQRELREARAPRGSMARTLRCPACNGRSLIHFKRVQEHAKDGVLVELALQIEPRRWGTKEHAPTSAFACRGCGLVEWHARGLDDVKPNDDVELIETPDEPAPTSGPFR